ncbi:c-type cytochrome domain-containing protein [Planctomicrobium sp. SH664]|uniref:c-type cytochrome domain-containing protein n=1 Tax=Planctomicrobium sp. SH664 TaxID=3448125 RepID=UPI003F5B0386
MSRLWLIIAWGCLILVNTFPAYAELTPDHRKELRELSTRLQQVPVHIRKKEYTEADALLKDVQKKVDDIVAAAGIDSSDRALKPLLTALERQKIALSKAQGAGKAAAGVDFAAEVAPIISSRCLDCHGADNPRAGLRLDTFANWRRGGKSGILLRPGAADRSLLIARLKAPEDRGRMPRGKPALSEEEIDKIAAWINGGAKFQGSDTANLSDLAFEAEKKTLNVKLPVATGNEKVKFTRDIAPWFTTLCLNCHNSNRKSGGLSVESYFDIMKGGESGEVIIPGDAENSRLFRLVGGLELPRMPQGQARITRKNYEDLKTWFQEGNTFDGRDPRTSIRTFEAPAVDTEAAKALALSDDDFRKARLDKTREQWRRWMGREKSEELQTEDFALIGNVTAPRLQELSQLAGSQWAAMRQALDAPAHPWRGRLAIFVLNTRDAYQTVHEAASEKRPDREQHGTFRVTGGQADALIVIEDTADDEVGQTLLQQLTGAYLSQSGRTAPRWLVQGLALAMDDSQLPEDQKRKMLQTAASIIPTVASPEEVLADSSFSAATMDAVGYALVKFLLANGGWPKLKQLTAEISEGKPQLEAFKTVYGKDSVAFAQAYLASLKQR